MYACITAFEIVTLRVSYATYAKLLHTFIWGLKERIRQEMRLRALISLQDVALIALDVEKWLKSVLLVHPMQGQYRDDGKPMPQQRAAPHHGPAPMEFDNLQTKCK